VLLVEDHPLMQQTIRDIVAGCCEVIGLVVNGGEVVGTACRLLPDVVLLDVSLPGESGMTVLPQLRATLPHTAIVMLTTLTYPAFRMEALARGANAFVCKGQAATELLPAIREALAASGLERQPA